MRTVVPSGLSGYSGKAFNFTKNIRGNGNDTAKILGAVIKNILGLFLIHLWASCAGTH